MSRTEELTAFLGQQVQVTYGREPNRITQGLLLMIADSGEFVIEMDDGFQM